MKIVMEDIIPRIVNLPILIKSGYHLGQCGCLSLIKRVFSRKAKEEACGKKGTIA